MSKIEFIITTFTKKKYAPKLALLNEKKVKQIPLVFEIEIWLWQLATMSIYKILLRNSFFLANNLSNFASLCWKNNNPYYHSADVQDR